MATADHNLEILSTALTAHARAEAAAIANPSTKTFRAENRAISILEDAAVACGMDRSHGDLMGWAAERVAQWLVSA